MVVLAELVTLNKRVSLRRGVLLVFVVLGTAMSIATDFESTWGGVAIAGLWLPLSAMLKVSWAAAEKEVGRCHMYSVPSSALGCGHELDRPYL